MTTMSKVTHPVIISGTGPAGLLFAHALLRANPPIPFRLFERDATMDFRTQGYRFGIQPNGVQAMRDILTPDHFSLLCNTGADMPNQSIPPMIKVDGMTGELLPMPMFGKGRPQQNAGPKSGHAQQSANAGPSRLSVDRTLLRRVLFRGLEKFTTFDSAVVGYDLPKAGDESSTAATQTDESGIVVKLADGSTIMGSLLVAADGSFSRTVKQLAPGFEVLDSEMRMIFGKTFLTPEFYAAIGAEDKDDPIATDLLKSLTLIAETDAPSDQAPMFFMFDPMRFGGRSAAEEADAEIGQSIPKDYVYWALSLRNDRPEVKELDWSTKDATTVYEFAVARTKKWTSKLRAVVEQADPAQTLPYRSGVAPTPLPDWRQSDAMVTPIGDAAHAMPPTGGQGASTALQDAAALAAALIEHGITTKALQVYESEMTKYATAAVVQSLMGGKMLVSMRDVSEMKPMRA